MTWLQVIPESLHQSDHSSAISLHKHTAQLWWRSVDRINYSHKLAAFASVELKPPTWIKGGRWCTTNRALWMCLTSGGNSPQLCVCRTNVKSLTCVVNCLNCLNPPGSVAKNRQTWPEVNVDSETVLPHRKSFASNGPAQGCQFGLLEAIFQKRPYRKVGGLKKSRN